MAEPFESTLARHRAELLRHSYRMLGSFHDAEEAVQEGLLNAWQARASYTGAAPVRHWLFRIVTNTCLNARKAKRRLAEHQFPPAAAQAELPSAVDPHGFVTPAADAALFPLATEADPARHAEARESIALAFVALLQELPPKPRAAWLLKDVVGFSVDEIAEALELSAPAVASALHRARAQLESEHEPRRLREPSRALVGEYVRCWERRDLSALLELLHRDIELTMPPFPFWFDGKQAVARFFASPGFQSFWASGLRVVPTRANGQLAFLFHRDGGQLRHSVQLASFDGTCFTALPTFIGAYFLEGFVDSPS
jgi:RNA polymerase sigma-70 factor (ECF subfamily)